MRKFLVWWWWCFLPLVFATMTSFSGCREFSVRYVVDDPALAPFAEVAAAYWNARGEDVRASLSPNTQIFEVADVPEQDGSVNAEWWGNGLERWCVVRYEGIFLQQDAEPIAGTLAHEFGHCMGYRHLAFSGDNGGEGWADGECDVMIPRPECEWLEIPPR